jgi:hypothetical protein
MALDTKEVRKMIIADTFDTDDNPPFIIEKPKPPAPKRTWVPKPLSVDEDQPLLDDDDDDEGTVEDEEAFLNWHPRPGPPPT